MRSLLFLIALTLFTEVCAAQLTGKEVKVSDGDTLTLLTPDNRQVKI